MQNRKKNLWLMALAGALTIAFASGCPDDDKTSEDGSKSKHKDDGELEDKDFTFQEITALSETNTYKNKKIDFITISGDKSTAYVINNSKAEIHVLKDANKIDKQDGWVKIDIKGASTNGAGAAVSQVNLAQAASVKAIFPYSAGAVITTVGGVDNANQQGIILMKKDVKEKTYSTKPATSIHTGAGGGNGPGTMGFAAVADIGGVENLIAIKVDGTTGGSVLLTDNTLINTGVGATTNGAGNLGKAFVATPSLNFVAKAGGVERIAALNTFIPHGGAGTGYDSAVATNEWKHANATPNGDINALAFHSGNLYIGLNKGAADTGGVVIISGATATAGAVVKIDAATKDKTIHAFAVRKNGEVFAFADTDIFVFKGAATRPTATYNKAFVDGKKGDKTEKKAKEGWIGDLSMTKMNSGAWLSDDLLLVGDANDGLATINFKNKETIKMPKDS